MIRRSFCAATAAAALFVAACSSPKPTPAKPKEPQKPKEPITARQAFQRVFGAARQWAPDAQILQIENLNLREVKSVGGKSGAWQITLVSPSRGVAKLFTYSVTEAEGNIHEGVFQHPEEAYSGPRGQTSPFLLQALKVDSNEAYDIALKKSAEHVKKNPDQPVNFLLQQTRRHPQPAWRVIWGDSLATSSYSVFVDAATGAYLETMR